MADLRATCSRYAPIWLSAAWSMSLTTLGFFVVPLLFARLPTPAMAGAMAGQLFAVQTWISLVLVLALLFFARGGRGSEPAATGVAGYSAVLLAGGLMALLVEFGATPHILARDNLPFWHGLASALYFGQWVCALFAFARNTRRD